MNLIGDLKIPGLAEALADLGVSPADVFDFSALPQYERSHVDLSRPPVSEVSGIRIRVRSTTRLGEREDIFLLPPKREGADPGVTRPGTVPDPKGE